HAGAATGIDIAPGPAGGTELTAVFDPAQVAAASASALLRRCALALERGRADPDRPLQTADLVTEAERAALLGWADGGTSEQPAGTLHALVRERAQQAPESVAVRAVDAELTYRELVALASALAARLRGLGVGREHRVAVCLPRTTAL